MKIKYEGKTYDTSTSHFIGEADYDVWCGALYKTPEGHFFLYGHNLALAGSGHLDLSHCSLDFTECDYRNNIRMLPLREHDALQWAKIHLVGDSD